MNSIQFNIETKRFGYEGRFSDFVPEIRQKSQSCRKNNTAICHRVSFYIMAKSLINALNFYICNYYAGTIASKETVFYIIGIIIAVTGAFTKEFEVSEKYVDNFLKHGNVKEDYLFYLNNVLDLLEDPAKDENDFVNFMLCVEGYLNRILDDLNNEEFNLRIGNASWNSSVSNAFDCFNLVQPKILTPAERNDAPLAGQFGDEKYNPVIFKLTGDDAKVIWYLTKATKGGGDNFDESEVFVFTPVLEQKENFVVAISQSCRTESLKDCIGIYDYSNIIYQNPYKEGEIIDFHTGEPVEGDLKDYIKNAGVVLSN